MTILTKVWTLSVHDMWLLAPLILLTCYVIMQKLMQARKTATDAAGPSFVRPWGENHPSQQENTAGNEDEVCVEYTSSQCSLVKAVSAWKY